MKNKSLIVQRFNNSKVPVIIAFFFLAAFSTQAQKIDNYYIEMPDILNPVIKKQQRLELLEYFKADMGDSIENRFGNQTHILHLDTLHNYITVKNTDVSTFEMKIFRSGNDTIIGIIKTICTPICQSIVDFYDLQWQKRSDITFRFPKTTDWINTEKLRESGLKEENVWNTLNINFISLSFAGETNEIMAKNNSLEFLDKEEKELLTSIVNDTDFIYQYTNGSWIKK